MSSLKRFLAIFKARNLEFLRDRGSLAWNILFPVLVVFGFAFAFRGGNDNVFKVAVHPSPEAAAAASPATAEFLKTQYVQFIPAANLDQSLAKLRRHQIDMLLSVEQAERYWINSTAPKGYLLEKILWSASATAGGKPPQVRQAVEGEEIRYVDWLISGLLGMNMMFSALFGVGYVIVRYRKMGVLRRLKATPLNALNFISAQVVSRYILIISVTAVVFIGCDFFIRFQMHGSYADLFLVLSLGAVCLISLGLLIAARISSEELAGGLLNLISWPMMFLSGVWFSLEGAAPWVQKVAVIFPLTHVIDAARAIMTEGATLMAVSDHLIALSAMTAVFIAAGSALFRWE